MISTLSSIYQMNEGELKKKKRLTSQPPAMDLLSNLKKKKREPEKLIFFFSSFIFYFTPVKKIEINIFKNLFYRWHIHFFFFFFVFPSLSLEFGCLVKSATRTPPFSGLYFIFFVFFSLRENGSSRTRRSDS